MNTITDSDRNCLHIRWSEDKESAHITMQSRETPTSEYQLVLDVDLTRTQYLGLLDGLEAAFPTWRNWKARHSSIVVNPSDTLLREHNIDSS